MHAVFLGQLRHGASDLHGFQRHTSLEASVMVPAFRHILISSFVETSRRHIVAYVTVRLSGGAHSGYRPFLRRTHLIVKL
jgi:hypothetical protein